MHRRVRRVALAVTAVIVVTIAGGVTYAVAGIGGGGVINGCYKAQNGQLRLIDPATDHCLPSEKSISWNQTGTQGPPGPTGPKGATGATGATGPAGLPPVDSFTPTQLVQSAILTCTTTNTTATTTSCQGLKLNGLNVRLDIPEANRICNTVTGAGFNFGTGSGLAGNPHFIWTGTAWTLSSASVPP
jgi:hypothetical protein